MSRKYTPLPGFQRKVSSPPRKSSRKIALVLTCALSAGALGVAGYAIYEATRPDPEFTQEKVEDQNTYQNNTYREGYGYYHALSRTWFPYPWGANDPARGYFYDGQWTQEKRASAPPPASSPGFVARKSGDGGSQSSDGSGGTTRGGFGKSGHAVAS